MKFRIAVNGREVRNPVIRFAFVVAALLLGATIGLVLLLVLLPLIGVAVTLWIGLAVALVVCFAAVVILALGRSMGAKWNRQRPAMPDPDRRIKKRD